MLPACGHNAHRPVPQFALRATQSQIDPPTSENLQKSQHQLTETSFITDRGFANCEVRAIGLVPDGEADQLGQNLTTEYREIQTGESRMN